MTNGELADYAMSQFMRSKEIVVKMEQLVTASRKRCTQMKSDKDFSVICKKYFEQKGANADV